MSDSAVLSVEASAQDQVPLSSAADLALAGFATAQYLPLFGGAQLDIEGLGLGAGSVWARGALVTIGNPPIIFFSGNQPVFTNQPQPVQVDPTQPASTNWPGPNVVAPTNVSSANNPAFVGNQPVNYEPPQYVQINDVEPPTLNWPEPPNYPPEPPPENPG